MEWGRATIGWQEDGIYERHSLSGLYASNEVGCLYSSNFSAIAYKIGATFTATVYPDPTNTGML